MSSSKWGNDVPLYRRGDRGPGLAVAHRLSDTELRRLGPVVGDSVRLERQIDEIDRRLQRLDRTGRRDLRGMADHTYVIDSHAESTGDDAVTVDRGTDGSLTVQAHVADVPYFLEAGSPLDQRAAALARTVYLPDGRERLFPAPLYGDHFAFPARADRPANTVAFRFDTDASLDDVSIYRSIIRPGQRMAYDAADRLLRTPVWKADDATERGTIRDLEALKVAALSLAGDQPGELPHRWGMDRAMAVLQRAVNREATARLRGTGQGIYRNQGGAVGDWTRDAERYLQQEGLDVDPYRLAGADDPVQELSALYSETGSGVVGDLYYEARRWDAVEPTDPLAPRLPEPHRSSPVPFGHQELGVEAYARFTNPRSNYADIVNWRSVLEEDELSSISVGAVADNLNSIPR